MNQIVKKLKKKNTGKPEFVSTKEASPLHKNPVKILVKLLCRLFIGEAQNKSL